MNPGGKLAVRQGFEPWVQLLGPYNGLANRRLQPLGHLTATRMLTIYDISIYEAGDVPTIVPERLPSKRPECDANRRNFVS